MQPRFHLWLSLLLAAMPLPATPTAHADPPVGSTPAPSSAIPLSTLLDEREIVRVVDGVDDTVDAKDWRACRALFLDEIDVDFTSLAGGAPGRMTADALVGAWSKSLFAEKTSFHQRTNHRVTVRGDEAEVVSKGYAFNLLPSLGRTGSELWEVWGIYHHRLRRTAAGWRVAAISLTVTHARGNEKVREFVPGPTP